MSQIPSLVAPSSRTWLGLAREPLMGTPVLPTNTIPLSKSEYEPEDMPHFLEDLAIRGSMSHRFADILGVEDANFSYGGPVFGDVQGFWLDNVFGDLSTTGTSPANGTTTAQALAVGGTTTTLHSATGYSSASVVQIDSGSISEVVILSTAPAGTTITFAANPLRFAHNSGATVSTVSGPYCVDAETEILTEQGWKAHDTLCEGDVALTYNHKTGMSEWQEILEVCVFPAESRELILMEGRGHSSLTTPNHRWPIVTRYEQRVWKTTETLTSGNRIPAGAFCADLPQEVKYSDAFVELVAWAWTEGTFREGQSCRICQSHKNAENVERIDSALRKVFGEPVDALGHRSPVPRWRRYIDGPNTRFALNATAGKVVWAVAPNRIVRHEFLLSLTQAQLDLFIKVSMLADNCGSTRLGQKSRAAAETFQFAATLAGYPTSLLERVYKRDGYRMWQVTLQKRKWIMPVDAARMTKRNDITGWRTERVIHDGIVWCPRTPNQTWYARRRGNCYFTGNTHTFAVLNQTAGVSGVTGAQPPCHTATDFTGLTPSVGARSYPSLCVGSLDFTGNSESLLSDKISGNSWVSAAASSTPTNTTAFTTPIPNWRATATVGGTATYNITEFAFNYKRELGVYWTAQGAQNPYIIARGDLDITGSVKFGVSSNEDALNLMLLNNQGPLAVTVNNGQSGTAQIQFTFTCTGTDWIKSKPVRSGVVVGYDNEWRSHANTTDVGGSGGLGQGTVQLINNIPTY